MWQYVALQLVSYDIGPPLQFFILKMESLYDLQEPDIILRTCARIAKGCVRQCAKPTDDGIWVLGFSWGVLRFYVL